MLRLVIRLVTIEAFRALGRHKLRSGLAMLGITVGVATVICVLAIGRAGKAQALSALDALGENLVWVEAGSRSAAGVRTGSHGMTTLVPSDADAIRAEAPLIAHVSENIDGRVQIIGGSGNWQSQFRGISPDYIHIRRWELASGEFITDDDVIRATTVVVIGETVRHQLFGDVMPIGEQLRIKSSVFTVVGVLAPKGQSVTGQDQDDTIMMPWTTVRARVVGRGQTWLDDILCSARTPDDVKAAAAQVSDLMRDRHHIAAGAEDDFNIRHPEDLAKARIKSAETLQRLLFAIGLCSLLVGGIGIMNVMLASVVQRTAEIGIRMAIGARPSAIRIQFLGEALVLTSIAGGLGVVVGISTAPSFAQMLGWQIEVTQPTCYLAFVFSVCTGILSGYYPANRAAQLEPIQALAREA